MEATADAQTYTPEQIAAAMAYREHARAVERAKYHRNRDHRLAYARAYAERKRAERKAAEAEMPATTPAN